MTNPRQRRSCLIALAVALFALDGVTARVAQAELTTAQRRTINLAEADLRRANRLIESGKFDDAYPVVKRIGEALVQLEVEVDLSESGTRRMMTPLKRRLATARGMLELEGFEFPVAAAPMPRTPKAPTATPTPNRDPNQISFKSQVAPILVSRCVGCHGGNKPKGELSMETFELLSWGDSGSAIIDPGKSDVSKIIEVIRAGEMPPQESDKVTRAELQTLVAWIDQGAKFDGSDRNAALRDLAPATGKLPVVPEPDMSKGGVAFSTHIAPVVAKNCIMCHGGQRPRNRLDMTSFQRLMRGGMTGPAVTPGKPVGSLLIQKLKGTAADGNRMPLNAPPLSAKVVADFEKWISAGAPFDGPDPLAAIEDVAALALAKKSTHSQLAAQRAELADKNWQYALSDVEPAVAPTTNFLVYGSVGREQLDRIAAIAERQQKVAREALGLPAGEPLVKGRLTLFVFGHRIDYSEFVFMVEGRRPERSSKGHWHYSVVDAYGCVVPAKQDEYGLDPLVLQQIVGTTIAARTNVPRWFSEGTGRAITSAIHGDDARVRQWNEQLKIQVRRLTTPTGFLEARMPPEEADILSYGFVKHLMRVDRLYQQLLKGIWSGQPFADVFQSVYRQTPAEFAGTWLVTAKRKAK